MAMANCCSCKSVQDSREMQICPNCNGYICGDCGSNYAGHCANCFNEDESLIV